MTDRHQNFETYQGVAANVTVTADGVDWSAQTPTLAAKDVDGDFTVTGTAALSGSDTVFTFVLSDAYLAALGQDVRPFQVHVPQVGVITEGRWVHRDSFAD